MYKFVINSTDKNLFYSYFVPISSIMWRKIGYYPVTLMLGDEKEWYASPKTKYVYEQIKLKSTIVPISRINGFRDSTVVQISRVYASAFSFAADDYILTSDADMIPLNKAWFNQQDPNKAFHLFGADAYSRKRFPICYLGANAGTWRNVMGIAVNGIMSAMNTYLDHKRDDWNYDELLFTEKIQKSQFYPNRCQFIDRGWTEGRANNRLDRAAWNWQGQTNLFDCHSIRPGYANWNSLSCLLKAYFSDEDFKYAQEYTNTLNNL